MEKIRKKRIIILIVAFLTYWLSFFDRTLTSPTLPVLIKEWGMTMADAGMIASIMLFTYSLGHLPFGIMADKYKRAKLLIIGTLTVGVINFLFAFTSTFGSFLFLRGLIGLGAAAAHAPVMALISDWFPPRRRGLALSVIGVVTTLGPLTALYWGSAIMQRYGSWQPVFYLTIIPALIISALAIIYVRDVSPEERELINQEEQQDAEEHGMKVEKAPEVPFSFSAATRAITNKTLFITYVTWFLCFAEFIIILHFLPTLLIKIHGVPLAQGVSMSSGWLWSGLISALIGGWLSDRIGSRKWYVLGVASVFHIGIMAVPFIPVNMVFYYMFLLGLFWFGTTGPFYAWLGELAGRVNPALIATAFGIAIFFGDLGGAVGPWVSGLLGDRLGVKSMFYVAGLAGVLSCTLGAIFVPETIHRVKSKAS